MDRNEWARRFKSGATGNSRKKQKKVDEAKYMEHLDDSTKPSMFQGIKDMFGSKKKKKK
jgi:hypothetical protein